MAIPKNKNSLTDIKRIAIAGAGGIGGFVAAALYDYGVNRGQYPFADWQIDVYDDDIVDVGNLLHQNFTEDDLGKRKADLIAQRYFMNPVLRFMDEPDFKNYDLVFSCVDSMEFRNKLYNYGYTHPELVWIDGRCNSRTVALYHSMIARKQLDADLTNSKERAGCLRPVDKQAKLSHVTPQIIAGMMVQTFLNMLRGEQTNEKQILFI
jgi:molybdopterin/thiamine biosynthesis adenylyltransferase